MTDKKKDPAKKSTDEAKAIFRKGARAAGGETSVFVKVKADEPVSFVPLVPLDEMTSIDQHEFWDTNPALIFPCIGSKVCPACKAGNKPKYKGFLPVMLRDEAEPKILAFGITVERQIGSIAEEIGDITGQVFRLKKTGTGMTTKYTIVPTGKKVDVSKVEIINPEDHIMVLDQEEITIKMRALGEIGGEEEAEPEGKPMSSVKEEDDEWGKGDV